MDKPFRLGFGRYARIINRCLRLGAASERYQGGRLYTRGPILVPGRCLRGAGSEPVVRCVGGYEVTVWSDERLEPTAESLERLQVGTAGEPPSEHTEDHAV